MRGNEQPKSQAFVVGQTTKDSEKPLDNVEQQQIFHTVELNIEVHKHLTFMLP